eukprot:jgi/Hompol1/3978/HPOL_006863-RA
MPAQGPIAASSPLAMTSEFDRLPTSPQPARLAAAGRPPRPSINAPSSALGLGDSLFSQGFGSLSSGNPRSHSQGSAHSTPRRTTRGDINPSGALERYLVRDPVVQGASQARSADLAAMSDDIPLPLPSDAAIGNNAADPAEVRKFIWGTTVNIEASMATFRDFILNFTLKHKLDALNEPSTSIDDSQPFYDRLLRQLRDIELYSMNLDCSNLYHYPPSKGLYEQLIRYPQEIVPLMDHTLTDIFLEKFEDAQLPPGESLR